MLAQACTGVSYSQAVIKEGSTPTALPPWASSVVLQHIQYFLSAKNTGKVSFIPFLPRRDTLNPALEQSPIAIQLLRGLVEVSAIRG